MHVPTVLAQRVLAFHIFGADEVIVLEHNPSIRSRKLPKGGLDDAGSASAWLLR
jgi:hypothetical protein